VIDRYLAARSIGLRIQPERSTAAERDDWMVTRGIMGKRGQRNLPRNGHKSSPQFVRHCSKAIRSNTNSLKPDVRYRGGSEPIPTPETEPFLRPGDTGDSDAGRLLGIRIIPGMSMPDRSGDVMARLRIGRQSLQYHTGDTPKQNTRQMRRSDGSNPIKSPSSATVNNRRRPRFPYKIRFQNAPTHNARRDRLGKRK